MKPVRIFVRGGYPQGPWLDVADADYLLLPIEGDNVGGLEPGMVDFLRAMAKSRWEAEGYVTGRYCDKIAAAIAAILQEAEVNLSDKVGSFDDNKEAEE